MPEFEKLCELTFDGFVKKFIIIKECDKIKKNDEIKEIIRNLILQDYLWCQLITESDRITFKNTLLALQVFNRFANDYKIRVKDAITVFQEYLNTY